MRDSYRPIPITAQEQREQNARQSNALSVLVGVLLVVMVGLGLWWNGR